MAASPGNEAHGAYAFCVLACLSMLGQPSHILHRFGVSFSLSINRPNPAPRYLDLPSLLSWLSARQYAPEGGFSGRTNKLVDSCYSHWVGGCWPFIDAALGHDKNYAPGELSIDRAFCNQEGLARYVLSCAQAEKGGLRDKPLK